MSVIGMQLPPPDEALADGLADALVLADGLAEEAAGVGVAVLVAPVGEK